MKVLIVVCAIFAAVAADETCLKDIERACNPPSGKAPIVIQKCDAIYGGIRALEVDLQKYVNDHISTSFAYLLMSTHYASYQKSRAGFEKLFRTLSDSKWNTALDLIKYINHRGGKMEFLADESQIPKSGVYELHEVKAVAKALDIEKSLATEAQRIHEKAIRHKQQHHDPEISSYIEEKFVHKQADTIRTLSGYMADLEKFAADKIDNSLSLHLFDEFLQGN
ncbi:unnamed protein product [Brassicogethes aeneus]|uniref:Ferritin n=1 Tax=Brassicogethes aeneus TaxID=1431903 RepID=A0A9P0BDA3_BRAAE|nr:unnamed protein product [Brassicogethes aeneus]